ncbi:uncharacterized protein si:ch211-79k12.1 [Tachysurus fulvidraco]|uniref:uncharacterized protein si:ch211-79k12.1 n=1 Tax=Tachysurus fulvidraco TaxID=1234273 RepID=UPI000F4EFAEB|nr:uncharacterized protein si:ch211-79k12.1 [Tachysurus fulvidraco]
MKFSVLFIAVMVGLVRDNTASLFVQGPTENVMEGDRVTLECLDTEAETNMSSVHFEKLSRHTEMWHRLDMSGYGYYYRRCFWYDADVTREDGRLLLTLARVQSWSAGMYRCMPDITDLDNSSVPFKLTVHFLREVSVNRAGSSTFYRYLAPEDELRVPQGEDVELDCSSSGSETPTYTWLKEGEDWIIPSSKIKLKNVHEENSGKYTCTAQHPTVSSLIKKRTIKLTVLPEESAWYESTTGRIYLIMSAALAVFLVIIMAMTIFLCRRTRPNKSKGPIDDQSQTKPIYKNSVESLNSTTGDKQPLV